MSTTDTKEQTNESGAAEESRAQNGSSKGKKALKVGALAAAAGTAAFAASKAISAKGEEGGETAKAKSEDGASRVRSGRASMDQIVSAVGNARWDVVKDLVMPFAENGARSAGAFVAKEGPDILSESLIPKFLEGFNEAQGQR